MHTISPSLEFYLGCFNGSIESLEPFFAAVNSELNEGKKNLQLSENRFARLIEQTSNGIALLNASGIITYVTPSVLKTFGYAEHELINNPNLQIGHPEEKVLLNEFIAEIMSQPGKKGEVIYRVKTKTGEWRWVKSHVTNLLHEKGINALVFNYDDITDNIILQEQCDFEKSNTEALINSTSDLMWSVDTQMKLITANKPFIERIKKQHRLILKPGDSVLDPAWVEDPRIKKWLEYYLRGLSGVSFTVNDFFETPEGKRWEETTFFPIYEKGRVKGVSCFLRDITDKKIAFEIISKNQALLSTAQSIANFGSWEALVGETEPIIDESLLWSDELYRIFGLQPSEMKISLRKFHSFIHPEDFTLMQQSMRNAIQHKTNYEAEYRIIRAGGEIAWIRSVGRVIQTDGGTPLKIIGTAQDITSRKQAEQERTQLIQELLRKNKDLEQFAYVISHNLRGPVANILGLANVFKDFANGNDIGIKCAEGIQQAAMRLDEVIKDMHQILQIREQFSEKKSKVSLLQLVRDVQESIYAYVQAQQGTINCDFEAMPEVFTIRGYLYSIFYNIILNALKYRQTEIAPVVNISSEVKGNNILLTFSDNGIGIDMDRFKNKLFSLYQRFHTHIGGRGMGLYLVKTQVEALSGTIGVESKLNEGTRFKISFPI